MSLTSGAFVGVKMIVSWPKARLSRSLVHAPPRPSGASHRLTAAPPVIETFFSLPPAKKPIHWPSGEKNG
jgi:hypothetical protein